MKIRSHTEDDLRRVEALMAAGGDEIAAFARRLAGTAAAAAALARYGPRDRDTPKSGACGTTPDS